MSTSLLDKITDAHDLLVKEFARRKQNALEHNEALIAHEWQEEIAAVDRQQHFLATDSEAKAAIEEWMSRYTNLSSE